MYPRWKMVTVEGDEKWIEDMAQRGDPVIASYWKMKKVDKGDRTIIAY